MGRDCGGVGLFPPLSFLTESITGATGRAAAAVLLPATVSFFTLFFWTESHPVAQAVLELCVAHAGLKFSTLRFEAF